MILDQRSSPSSGWIFWIAHAGFWLAAFAAAMIVTWAFKPTLTDPSRFIGSRVMAAAILTLLLRFAARNSRLTDRLGISKTGLMIGGPLAGAVLITLAFAGLEALRGGVPAVDDARTAVATRLGIAACFVIDLVMLSTWSAAYFGVQLLREQRATELRAFEAETLAVRNELGHLQANISPHFLFNALNTILACKHSPDDIETITQSLAKYLRFLLRPTATLEPLGREIDALEEYLTIQSFRFGDRLACRIDCDASIRRIPVLPTMIQPLVENALKYGRAPDGLPLEVTVQARRNGDRLYIEVANTGRWIVPDGVSTGTGLHNLRRRLFLHGGPEARVTTREDERNVRIEIQIPLAPEYAEQPETVTSLPETTG